MAGFRASNAIVFLPAHTLGLHGRPVAPDGAYGDKPGGGLVAALGRDELSPIIARESCFSFPST